MPAPTRTPGAHRPDIDGLRAVAVLPVVLFHAQVASWSGGFVGVDVFFVISGYLISTLILAELETGGFSPAGFYERRIRRILPALFVVLLVASIGAYRLLLPDDAMAFGGSLMAALVFSSNVLFAGQTGYFDQPAETKPLLHTWSLGVEEQFYLAYPLFLILVGRYGRQRYPLAIGLMLVLSFGLSLWSTTASPGRAFYLAPGRLWELLVGGFLATRVIPEIRNQRWAALLGLVGLAAIGYSVIAFYSATPLPGWHALIPVLGAAAVIHSGAGAASLVSRALSAAPLVFVGLISYSLYLWHWILLVFVRYFVIRPMTGLETTVTITASFALAILSWRFVERPFRGPRGIGSRSAVFAGALIGSLALGAFGLLTTTTGGLPGRFGPETMRFLGGKNDVWARRSECIDRPCRIGGPAAEETFMLWGDSHAGAVAPAMEQAAVAGRRTGLLVTRNACPPLIRLTPYDRDHESCAAFTDSVLALIDARSIRSVVLHARWGFYAEGEPYPAENRLAPTQRMLDNAAAFEPMLRATLAALRARRLEVAIVASIPDVGIRVPTALAQRSRSGSPVEIAPRLDDFLARQAVAFGVLRRIAAENQVRLVFPHEVLCDQATCAIEQDGWALYTDGDHLSVRGAQRLEPILAEVLTRAR